MRIELRTEGGLAAFPGLARPVTCDTGSLSQEDARQLAALVEASGLLAAPGSRRRAGGQAQRGADRRRYILTVEDDQRRRTVTVEDPLPPSLASLVEFVRRRQRG